MASETTENAGGASRGPVEALRGAMQGLHREIGEQHKELVAAQGLLNTQVARELNAVLTLATDGFRDAAREQDNIVALIRYLHETQRAQGRLLTTLIVTLWLCMVIGFALLIYWG